MNKKDEYFPGDFIAFDRDWESKYSDKVGIVVKKILRSELDRRVYWFKHDYEYLVSLKQYNGDYGVVTYQDILGEKDLPREYKLSYIASFDNWWYHSFKSLYQSLLIEILN
tara:strand:+ start:149 stop:481 length:333 start_codon:yes stop_codon:yes gene_type:complete